MPNSRSACASVIIAALTEKIPVSVGVSRRDSTMTLTKPITELPMRATADIARARRTLRPFIEPAARAHAARVNPAMRRRSDPRLLDENESNGQSRLPARGRKRRPILLGAGLAQALIIDLDRPLDDIFPGAIGHQAATFLGGRARLENLRDRMLDIALAIGIALDERAAVRADVEAMIFRQDRGRARGERLQGGGRRHFGLARQNEGFGGGEGRRQQGILMVEIADMADASVAR